MFEMLVRDDDDRQKIFDFAIIVMTLLSTRLLRQSATVMDSYVVLSLKILSEYEWVVVIVLRAITIVGN